MGRDKNTSGFGDEYKVLVPAYFSLVLHNNKDVEDFCFKTNDSDHVIIEMVTKDGVNTNFVCQVKHKEKNNKCLVPGFEIGGDFSIEKYCAEFKEMDDNCKMHNYYIMFSNIQFDKNKIKKIKHFDMVEREQFEGSIFNTSVNHENIYSFEINVNTPESDRVDKEDYKKFLPRFSLFCGQKNYQQLEEAISSILPNDAWLKYIHLWRKWHLGEFTNRCIDKKTVTLHLIDVLTSSCSVSNYHLSTTPCSSVQLFEEAVKEFDVTIIGEPKYFFEYLEKGEVHELENYSSHQIKNQLEQYIEEYKIAALEDFETKSEEIMENCFILLAKKYKFLKKTATDINPDIKLKVLYYIFGKPLILRFDETTKDFIYEVVEMCQRLNIKVVLLGVGVDKNQVKKFSVFQNLKDLKNPVLFEAIRTRCNNYVTEFEDMLTETLYQVLKGTMRYVLASIQADSDSFKHNRNTRKR